MLTVAGCSLKFCVGSSGVQAIVYVVCCVMGLDEYVPDETVPIKVPLNLSPLVPVTVHPWGFAPLDWTLSVIHETVVVAPLETIAGSTLSVPPRPEGAVCGYWQVADPVTQNALIGQEADVAVTLQLASV